MFKTKCAIGYVPLLLYSWHCAHVLFALGSVLCRMYYELCVLFFVLLICDICYLLCAMCYVRCNLSYIICYGLLYTVLCSGSQISFDVFG